MSAAISPRAASGGADHQTRRLRARIHSALVLRSNPPPGSLAGVAIGAAATPTRGSALAAAIDAARS
jgi:hypothetical protein